MKDKFWSKGTTQLIGATTYTVEALRVHLDKFRLNFAEQMDEEMTDYLMCAFDKIDTIKQMLNTAYEFSEIGQVE